MRLHRHDLRGRIQTVLGLINPAELGPTLMHEHILWDIRTPDMRADPDQGPEITLCNCWKINYRQIKAPRNSQFNCEAIAAQEVAEIRDSGGRSIVEMSCGGLDPNPAGLANVSRMSGVQIVMGCGHYVDEYQSPANRDRTVDDFAQEIAAQVLDGAWGTDVRAGIIGEIGCQAPWTDLEKRVMRAALIAQAETGAAVNVHPGRHPDQPQEVADMVRASGGDISRVIISHIDRTIFDDTRLLRLADSGCVLEFDLFGTEQSYYPLSDIDMPNDAVRLRMLRTLIEHGHLDRVVISHDICSRTRLSSFGGHGYGHIFANILPMMRRRNFSEAEIQAIMVDNPRRLLTIV
ncbi:MAG: phosphotriesterase [Acetobacteraceae bacterium]